VREEFPRPEVPEPQGQRRLAVVFVDFENLARVADVSVLAELDLPEVVDAELLLVVLAFVFAVVDLGFWGGEGAVRGEAALEFGRLEHNQIPALNKSLLRLFLVISLMQNDFESCILEL
jgi:hypothetical protein